MTKIGKRSGSYGCTCTTESGKFKGDTLDTILKDDKGKNVMGAIYPNVTTDEMVSGVESPSSQENTETRRFVIHHSADKEMTIEQIAEMSGLAENLGFSSERLFLVVGQIIIFTAAQTTWKLTYVTT